MGTECCCCNAANIEVNEVQILLRRKLAPGRPSTIPLCAACADALPFDIGALVEHANTFRSYEDDKLKDAMLLDFVTRFIRDIWIEDSPPTFNDLAHVLNAVGIRSQQGKAWSYNNLKYKLDALRIDRTVHILERKTSTYAERLNELQDRAAAYLCTHKQYAPTPLALEPPPNIAALPEDMPGQPATLASKL